MDRGAWQATVHGATELDTTERLTHTYTHTYTWILAKEEGPLGMFPLGENKYKERVGREGDLLGNPHG